MAKSTSPKQLTKKKQPIHKVFQISNRLAVLLILAMVALVYGQSLWFGFTWFDDDAILLRNEPFVSNISNLTKAITRDAEFHEQSMELYRPLQNISFMIDAALGGFRRPGMFHFTSLLLHACSSLLLFFMLKKLNFSTAWSLGGALLLAVHPVFAFTVCWLPARGDLLLALFVLASALLFLEFLEKGRPLMLAAHLLTFFLALMAKESAVMLIPILAIFYFRKMKRYQWAKWHPILAAGYLVSLAVFLCLRFASVTSVREGAFGFSGFSGNLKVLPEVILKFFFPWPMVALPFYSMPVTLGGMFIILFIIYLVFKQKNSGLTMLAAVSWFLLFSLPAMIYRPQWSDYIYDYVIHRSYVPLIGIIMILLLVLEKFKSKIPSRAGIYFSVVLGIILIIFNVRFSGAFADPLSFWSYAVKTNPRSAFAQTYLGGAQFFSGKSGEAIESYNLALKLKPDFREARLNRGITLASIGKHQNAIPDFDTCLMSTPNDTMLLRYRALSLSETGNFRGALEDVKQLIALGDTTRRARFQLGLSSLLTGNYSGAAQVFDSLLLMEPQNTQYLRLGALANLMNNEVDRAIGRYRMVIKLTSPDQNALSNLAYALWEKGEYREALNYFNMAADKGTEDLSINLGLLLTRYRLGDKIAVEETKTRAYILNPALKDFDKEIRRMTTQGYLFTAKQISGLREILQ